jgi:hypothetical protein
MHLNPVRVGWSRMLLSGAGVPRGGTGKGERREFPFNGPIDKKEGA